ncbi:MAG TPA: TonB-dependent receptor [Woeseiaceae bacterium]|nr:TonB-dependent receptor [Woeseiaceae bacterium]
MSHIASGQSTRLVVATAAMSFGIAVPVWAQTVTSSPDKSSEIARDASIEEIFVVARRREESIQDVPVAISAFSESDLYDAGIENVAQLAEVVPNMVFHAGAPIGGSTSTGSLYIRGVGSNEVSMGTEPGVGLYVDDVYLARSVGSVLDLVDIESVQVLRGPQGTLFGRNNVGGAILVKTRRPSDDFSGNVELTVGTEDRMEIQAAVNMPLSNSVRTRLSMLGGERDGYVNNLDGGDNLGEKNRLAGRGVLEWDAADNVIVTVTADASRERGSAIPSVLLGLVPVIPGTSTPTQIQELANLNLNCGGRSVLGNSGNPACIDQQYIQGPFDSFGGYVSPDPIFDSQGSRPYENKSDLDVWGVSMKLAWAVHESLTVNSITAWRELDGFWPSNSDHSPNPGAETKNDYQQEQFSQEIQLLGTAMNERLDWITGLYYFEENGENLNVVHFPAVIFRSGGKFATDSLALFAQASYDLSDVLEWTVGLRYTTEDKKYETENFQQIIGALLDPFTQTYLDFRANPIPFVFGPTPDLDFDEFTPSTSLAWHVGSQTMIYVSYAEGYKSGGYEQRLAPGTPVVPSFNPEYSKVYELGLKSTLADGRLAITSALFTNDYSGMQISVIDGVAPTLTNAGDATINGAELGLDWSPAQRTLVSANIGWLDASYDRLSERALASGVALGNSLPNVSEWQIAASLSHDFELWKNGVLTPRLDWSWRSEYSVDSANTPLLTQQDFHLLNASITWTSSNQRWAAVLAARNITDEAYLVAGLAQYSVGQTEGQFAWPSEWNLSVRYTF